MDFGKDFIWGAATAAFQIEGGWNADGKGMSNWDVISHQKGNVFGNHTGDTACDHYHRYKEDVALMRELGLKAYRFSLSWSRIIPNGTGDINPAGVEFYNNLINELIANGIEPCVTLYHWDLPYALQIRGGFFSPEMPEWFYNYAKLCGELFGDRVKRWITINEPQCIIARECERSNNKKSLRETLLATHTLLLAHGKAVSALRETVENSIIGYAPCADPVCPVSNSPEDIEAARKAYFSFSKDNYKSFNVPIFSDPIILGDYPQEYYEAFSDVMPEITKEDLALISQPIDFYGQNIYKGSFVRAGEDGKAVALDFAVGAEMSSMSWFVTPEALYWGPKFLYERYKLPFYITENGMADNDIRSRDGDFHDGSRIAYIERYLEQLCRAKADGADIRGYFYWSFMDNFEWNHGYSKKFGLIHVDYQTFKRTPKDSFYVYQEIIKNNGLKD